MGDRIRLSQSDKARGWIANTEYRVNDIQKDSVTLLDNQQQLLSLNRQQLKDSHWDYTYTSTGYNAQGATKPFVLDYELSFSKNITHQRSFYIALSRAGIHYMAYTDNKEALLNRLTHHPKNKWAALEVTGEMQRKSMNYSPSRPSNSIDRGPKNTTEKTMQWDVHDINQRLNEQAPQLLEKLLGAPKSQTGTHYQYSYSEHFGGDVGKGKGSLHIAVNGDKQGKWHCFKTGEGGYLLQLIQKNLQKAFADLGVKKIDCSKEFDPHFHEALMQVESTNHNPGQIVQVFEPGFTIRDLVIRHAKVSVAK